MMEVGPWRSDGKGGLKRIEGGWEEYTTMVYSAFPHTYLSRGSSYSLQSTSLLALGSHTPPQTNISTSSRRCALSNYKRRVAHPSNVSGVETYHGVSTQLLHGVSGIQADGCEL